MAQGYYTLQEAAQFLSMAEDELRQKAQKNQIRSFQDRGTLRFRVQDIQELARQRGAASDLDLPLGESPKTPRTPRLGQPGSKASKEDANDLFDFSLEVNDDLVDIGREPLSSGAKASGRSSKKSSPRPVPGSDSDVRLIADGDLAMHNQSDSDIRLVSQEKDSDVKVASSAARKKSSLAPATPPVKPKSQLASPTSPVQSKSKLAGPTSPPKPGSKLISPGSPLPQKKSSLRPPMAGSDSGVRLVPMDSDSDVKIVGRSDEVNLGAAPPVGATDSDIRLERFMGKPAAGDEAMLLTEEINLDEEIRKQEEALKQKPPQAKLKPKSKLSSFSPTSSPFELSDNDLDSPTGQSQQGTNPDSSDFDLLPQEPSTDSSDFDLVPAGDGSVLLEGGGADDFSLELPDDMDQTIAGDDFSNELKGPTSGINLADPGDEGLSLEEGGTEEDVDFEISLEGGATPRPAPEVGVEGAEADTSSEFEINLDDSSGEVLAQEEAAGESDFELGIDESSGEASSLTDNSDSEFELTLDSDESSSELEAAPSEESPSDSEFELTLDDSGNLANDEEAPAEEGGDKDIFETDFEVPGLEDESGSQVAALDTDLENSDFDIEVEDESGSQVVALDEEEETDEGAETIAKKTKGKTRVVQDDSEEDEGLGFEDLGTDEEGAAPATDEEEETVTAPAGETVVKVMRPAPWGVFPVLFMLPCVVVMVAVGIVGFELVQSSNGYKPPGILTKTLAELMNLKMK